MYFQKVLVCENQNEIRTEKKVKPVLKPNRKAPFVALEPVNKELERLEKLGVISKINYSNWVSPTVFVKKKNFKMRVWTCY